MSRRAFALTMISVLAALGLTLWLTTPRSAFGDDPPGMNIGYVDVTRVYNGYNKVLDRKKDLEQLYTGTIDRLKADQTALDKEKTNLESGAMDRTSDAYIARIKDFQERAYKVQYELKLTQREFALDVDRLTRETYQEILKELDAYARRHSYQLVLKIDADVTVEDPDLDPMQYVANRQILFYAQGRDITLPLVEVLNRNYVRK